MSTPLEQDGRRSVLLIEAAETPASRLASPSKRDFFRVMLRHATGSDTVALALGARYAREVPQLATDTDFSLPAMALTAWLDAVAVQFRSREFRPQAALLNGRGSLRQAFRPS